MLNVDLLLTHPKEFIQGFSYYYPVPEDLLIKYEEEWDWELLSKNMVMPWSVKLHNWGYILYRFVTIFENRCQLLNAVTQLYLHKLF